jgi:nucleoside-diphosphate-sugar epimerase
MPEPLARAGAAGLEILNRLTGVPVPLTRTGVDFFSEERAFTNRFTQEKLGYAPRIDLREGVERTVSWYRQEGYL